VAVREHRGNQPVRSDRLEVELLVFFKIDKSKIGADLTEAPFDRLPHLGHDAVVALLGGCHRGAFVGHLQRGVSVHIASVPEEAVQVTWCDDAVQQAPLKEFGHSKHPHVVRFSLVRSVHLGDHPIGSLDSLLGQAHTDKKLVAEYHRQKKGLHSPGGCFRAPSCAHCSTPLEQPPCNHPSQAFKTTEMSHRRGPRHLEGGSPSFGTQPQTRAEEG
jgi:hypothetical protein